MNTPNPIKYLLVGYGYWGPNLARNIKNDKNSVLTILVDINEDNLNIAKKKNVASIYLNDINKLDNVEMEDIDIIVVATPPKTHFQVVKELAKFEKDFLITKPVVTSSDEIRDIQKLIERYKFEIFVDETYIYSNKVKKIKEIINNDNFGELQYIYSNRSNLGLIQKEQNVIWDLAPHDLSIVSFITGFYPENSYALSSNPLKNIPSKDTIASLKLNYPSGIDFYLNLSWLSPEKRRYMIFSGTNQTLKYDDNVDTKSLTIYDQKISFDNNIYNYQKSSGIDIEVEYNEPLQDEISQLSSYKLTGENKPYSIFENSIKNIFALENITYL
jgi:predicted dehydrogenase